MSKQSKVRRNLYKDTIELIQFSLSTDGYKSYHEMQLIYPLRHHWRKLNSFASSCQLHIASCLKIGDYGYFFLSVLEPVQDLSILS